MYAASQAYKKLMKEPYIDQMMLMRVTVGVINQQAQADVSVFSPCTYFSDLKKPFNNYQAEELYAVCDQNYTIVGGGMYFLPRNKNDVVLNAGLVSEELLGTIEFRFTESYDLRGLTVEFGKAYPVDFAIVSDHKTVEVTGNASGRYVCQEIFEAATYLRFTPSRLVNGQGRFRILQITMGIGVYFDSRQITSATKKEHVSPIAEELPTLDLDVTIDNKDRAYDIENEESTVNFLEVGQEVTVLYGQELLDGSVEWLPGATAKLKEWEADDEEMSFSATDRFDGMEDIYYWGIYRPEGITLFDLAVDVLEDAGLDSRSYELDPYLKEVTIYNPMPAVTHKEALQLIANAGRCLLTQDREGRIVIKSNFVPDVMEAVASSDNEVYFSNSAGIFDKNVKTDYALTGRDYTASGRRQIFLPRDEEKILSTGYISQAVADKDGNFKENPTLEIELETSYRYFGLTLEFGPNGPTEMIFHSYQDQELLESYSVHDLKETTQVIHEFPEMNRLVLEFTKGTPYNRVILNQLLFGDNTDYVLEYGAELTETPKGTQLPKVRQLQIVRTLYSESTEESRELARETISLTAADNRYTFYFSNPSYELAVSVIEPQEGQKARIVESSCYFATVEIDGGMSPVEVAITGKEYVISTAKVARQLYQSGTVEVWENPLISDAIHAASLADWIGDYFRSDREYNLPYRGEPRIDANDIAFLENKYVPDLLVRIYDHTLKYDGGLSGTLKARRDMAYVDRAKNRLAGRRSV